MLECSFEGLFKSSALGLFRGFGASGLRVETPTCQASGNNLVFAAACIYNEIVSASSFGP